MTPRDVIDTIRCARKMQREGRKTEGKQLESETWEQMLAASNWTRFEYCEASRVQPYVGKRATEEDIRLRWRWNLKGYELTPPSERLPPKESIKFFLEGLLAIGTPSKVIIDALAGTGRLCAVCPRSNAASCALVMDDQGRISIRLDIPDGCPMSVERAVLIANGKE